MRDSYILHSCYSEASRKVCCKFVGVSRPGVPKPTSECAACPSPDGSSAWASAKGGSEVAGDGRERGGNPAAFSKKALVLPFIGVRRGSRCTMGM
jgi:hypothetical protein